MTRTVRIERRVLTGVVRIKRRVLTGVVRIERRVLTGAVRLALVALLALLAALAALLAGCGLGAGSTPKHLELTVTRDFGAHALAGPAGGVTRAAGQETVMSLLARNHRVSTRFGGGFVQSIDGHAGGQQGGEPTDWFYYVNGVEAPKGAADTSVHQGDSVWWDLHDWSQTDDIAAVVGSFPEPFRDGIDGKRYPVRVECAQVGSDPCKRVVAQLRALDVPAAIAGVGTTDEPNTLRLVVGTWAALSGAPSVQPIQQGPRASGVYARFGSGGRTLITLDAQGRPTQTLGAGAGLVAATRYIQQEPPVWIVTGTDAQGLEAAARAFNAASLHNRFALAVAPTGAALALPTP